MLFNIMDCKPCDIVSAICIVIVLFIFCSPRKFKNYDPLKSGGEKSIGEVKKQKGRSAGKYTRIKKEENLKIQTSPVIGGLALEDENGRLLGTISIFSKLSDEKAKEVHEYLLALFSDGTEQQGRVDPRIARRSI